MTIIKRQVIAVMPECCPWTG